MSNKEKETKPIQDKESAQNNQQVQQNAYNEAIDKLKKLREKLTIGKAKKMKCKTKADK